MDARLLVLPSFFTMKKFLASLLIITLLPVISQASNFDNFGRLKLAQTVASRAENDDYTSLIIEIDDESSLEELDKIGAVIANRRNNIWPEPRYELDADDLRDLP